MNSKLAILITQHSGTPVTPLSRYTVDELHNEYFQLLFQMAYSMKMQLLRVSDDSGNNPHESNGNDSTRQSLRELLSDQKNKENFPRL